MADDAAREGDTENGQIAKALLRDLVGRGLDPQLAQLFVIDGAKALRSAIRKIFGDQGVVQRCQLHKERNILGHLPERVQLSVKAILREAWSLHDAKLAKATARTACLLSRSFTVLGPAQTSPRALGAILKRRRLELASPRGGST